MLFMQVRLNSNENEIPAEIGVLMALYDVEAIFAINDKEINIPLSTAEFEGLKAMLDITEDKHLLLPIDLVNKKVILDANVPEISIDELQFDD